MREYYYLCPHFKYWLVKVMKCTNCCVEHHILSPGYNTIYRCLSVSSNITGRNAFSGVTMSRYSPHRTPNRPVPGILED